MIILSICGDMEYFREKTNSFTAHGQNVPNNTTQASKVYHQEARSFLFPEENKRIVFVVTCSYITAARLQNEE